MSRNNDTIAAIATPVGEGGISIVRMSGPAAIEIAARIFRPASISRRIADSPSHRLNYGWLIDPKTDEPIDEVLLSVMRAPHTYTREDIVEINCHGGSLVTRRIMQLLIDEGARIAEPGEFTRRAFLNGRIDLSQAEAVIDLISAKTELSLKAANRQLSGVLSQKITSLRDAIAQTLAEVESSIDFPEEDLDFLPNDVLKSSLVEVRRQINALIETETRGRIIREGVQTVIVGKPNVGKSSLLNRLLQEDRAIVTDIPGTTRDSIEEYISIDGIPFKLVDTAGIRNTDDPVEIHGVKRSRDRMRQADLILFVLDSSSDLTEEERELLNESTNGKMIVVINKIDLERKLRIDSLRLPETVKVVEISALLEIGLDRLRSAMTEAVLIGEAATESSISVNIRHAEALRRARESLDHAIASLDREEPPELVAVDLRGAMNALGEIVGLITTDDILDRIFSQFCIGK